MRFLINALACMLCIHLVALLLVCSNATIPQTDTLYAGGTATIDGAKILFLRGTHYERGFQHGNLLDNEVQDVFHGLLVAYICKNRASLYDSARTFMQNHFNFEQRYCSEAQGMIAGMRDAGVILYDSTLGRDIDSFDLLILCSIEELYNITGFSFGCSSISSWGSATQGDSLLQGSLLITRHWDYVRIDAVIRNLLLIVHVPSESDENPWISGSWAGMISSCTAFNTNGLGAFLDYGYFFKREEIPNLALHHPVALSIRNGIEQQDYNDDGRESPRDVVRALQEYIPYFGSLIHVVSADTGDLRACIIESDNTRGVTIRTVYDNTEIPGKNLALTNHFRVLYPPEVCYRYERMVDSLQASTAMTLDRSWRFLAGTSQCPDNIYSISFAPAQGIIRWATTSLDDPLPAWDRPYATFSMSSLFAYIR